MNDLWAERIFIIVSSNGKDMLARYFHAGEKGTQSHPVEETSLVPLELCTVLALSTSTLCDPASCSCISVKQYGVTKVWNGCSSANTG